MTQMRYQYRGPEGITWTRWFNIPDTAPRSRYQYGRTLRNEYRTIN